MKIDLADIDTILLHHSNANDRHWILICLVVLVPNRLGTHNEFCLLQLLPVTFACRWSNDLQYLKIKELLQRNFVFFLRNLKFYVLPIIVIELTAS